MGGIGSRHVHRRASRAKLVVRLAERLRGHCYSSLQHEGVGMTYHAYYDPPDDRAGTVFNPYDNTFGPIMAALQAGSFEAAHALIGALLSESRRTIPNA